MDKTAFIKWLLDYYNVPDYSYENQANKLKNGLLSNIVFAKIVDYLKNNKIKIMPTSIEINRIAQNNRYLRVDKPDCDALVYYRNLEKLPKYTMHDLPEDLKAKIINMCHKIGAKTVLENS